MEIAQIACRRGLTSTCMVAGGFMQRQILTYWALMLAVFLTLPEKASADLSAGQVVSMNPCPQPHSSDMIYSFFDNGVGEKVSNPILTAWSDPRLSGVIYCGHEKTYYAYSSLWSSPLTLTISHKVSPGSVEEKFLLPPNVFM